MFDCPFWAYYAASDTVFWQLSDSLSTSTVTLFGVAAIIHTQAHCITD